MKIYKDFDEWMDNDGKYASAVPIVAKRSGWNARQPEIDHLKELPEQLYKKVTKFKEEIKELKEEISNLWTLNKQQRIEKEDQLIEFNTLIIKIEEHLDE